MRRRRTLVRVGIVLGVALLLGLLAASLDFQHDLSSVHLSILSGSREGNYHAVAGRLARRIGAGHGSLRNVASAGSVDNVRRLVRAASRCDVQVALIQDGQEWPRNAELELLGRLPRSESVLLLGRDADRLDALEGLRGKRIGIGPAGSGVARIARQLFGSRDLSGLGARLESHSLAEQLDLAAEGRLDLALLVIDEDAPLVDRAIRERGLQIASLPHAAVLASRAPHLTTGRIDAGHYDPVRVLPATDKDVLRVDTLVVGNGCASRSELVGFLRALAEEMPDFLARNKGAPNDTGLPLASASKSFFDNDGPEIFDEWAPWLADIMPPGNWVYLVTVLSLLFNAMGFGNRFQLWRIDANRVRLEGELTKRFGETTTLGDIARLEPEPAHRTREFLESLHGVVASLEGLAARCRRQSLGVLVPMGQEMSYRYQETLIHETLAVLRAFMARAEQR